MSEDTACLGLYSFAKIKADVQRQSDRPRSFIIQNASAFSLIMHYAFYILHSFVLRVLDYISFAGGKLFVQLAKTQILHLQNLHLKPDGKYPPGLIFFLTKHGFFEKRATMILLN